MQISLADGDLNAHKDILISRVDHFKALFASGMKEALTNKVSILGYCVADFALVLEFVYRDRITSIFDSRQLATLMKIADYYNMADCMDHCLGHMDL